jgi:chromosome segregation ATPase
MTDPITDLPTAVAVLGALPMPVGGQREVRTLDVVEEELTGANLSLWEEEQDNARLRMALVSAQRGRRELRARVAELDAVRKERDEARAALRDAADQISELESDFAGAVVVSEALNQRLSEEQLAGSALYAALTMPTTPAQRQAALDKFTAVAQQVFGSEAAR